MKFTALQRLGRALMLPIAVLPIAGLLLRLGQPDLLALPFVAAAGDAIFSNLGLLFAIGIAIGFARDNHGAAGLAAAVGYLIATEGAKALLWIPSDLSGAAATTFKAQAIAKASVPTGIVSGLIASGMYNRFSEIRLPDWLAFFGGRRFVPIATGSACLLLAAMLGFGWETLEHGMDAFSDLVLSSGNVGLFLYGFLNRLLLITGLHHILNNIAWFVLGDWHGVTGDLKRFFAGDPTAGSFMAGFFPVMMFGLPGACLAMYHAVPRERRLAAAGLLASMALTSLLTGVTEPVEFSFMFLSPLLYFVHAILTGLSMVLTSILNVRIGFGFSAGLFDYVLNFTRGTNAILVLPVGLIWFFVYYGLFRVAIVMFDLKTPGRDAEETPVSSSPAASLSRGQAFVLALGGSENIVLVDACTTRLRLTLTDPRRIDEVGLHALGTVGIVRPSGDAVQIVLGPVADQVAGEIRAELRAGDTSTDWTLRLLVALGGKANLRSAIVHATRMIIEVIDDALVDEAALSRCSPRGFARPSVGSIHVLVAPGSNLEVVDLPTAQPTAGG